MGHELTCVTWNIHGAIGRDGGSRPELVACVLQNLQPDIVALQEVDGGVRGANGSDTLGLVSQHTGLSVVVGPARASMRGGMFGNALLSRQPPLAVRRGDISVPGREPRALLQADLAAAGRRVQVAVTHLGLRWWERDRQVEAVLSQLGEDPQRPGILCGDFNEWRPWAAPLRRLERAFGPAPAVRSFPVVLPLLPLDRILLRGPGKICRLWAYRHPWVALASDHLPVVARIQID